MWEPIGSDFGLPEQMHVFVLDVRLTQKDFLKKWQR